jgi:hypothetical protein
LTHATARSARRDFAAIIALALTLLAGSSGVWAQGTKGGPLPPGVAGCDFPALANDKTRQGLNIRAEPDIGSAILGRLPIVHTVDHEEVAAELHVIGVRNGWFLVEGAGYPADDEPRNKYPSVYRGRGWVSGRLLTTSMQTSSLKAAPDENAADVVIGGDFEATAILDCKGDWLRIETTLPSTDALKLKPPADAPKNTARGWGRHSCTNQRTTCDFGGDKVLLPLAAQISIGDAATRCLALPDERSSACKVEQFGRLGVEDATPLYFATYDYADNRDQGLDYWRVVILEDQGGGRLHELFATPGDPAVQYDKPRIIEIADRTLLLIPGHESGTGNLNREQLLVRRSYEWREGDSVTWLADLPQQLPSDLAVWKGVFPDYATMTAETPLWRAGDDNACPTGGRAKIMLEWLADRVVVRSVRVERSGECGEPLP